MSDQSAAQAGGFKVGDVVRYIGPHVAPGGDKSPSTGKPDDRGDIFRTRPQTSFLSTAKNNRMQRHCATHSQKSNTSRTIYFAAI